MSIKNYVGLVCDGKLSNLPGYSRLEGLPEQHGVISDKLGETVTHALAINTGWIAVRDNLAEVPIDRHYCPTCAPYYTAVPAIMDTRGKDSAK